MPDTVRSDSLVARGTDSTPTPTPELPQLWRIHLKPKPHEETDPRRFCFDRNVAGVGWPVKHEGATVDWGRYGALYPVCHPGDRSGLVATGFLREVRVGDLIWSRDWAGEYYLGRVTSPWRYEIDPEYERADIVNVVGCEWIRAGAVDVVPGRVVNAFRPARVLQRIRNEESLAYSMHLFSRRNDAEGTDFWQKRPSFRHGGDPFYFLSPDDCEDLVGLYLQERGWTILPSTCKPSTQTYEYLLHHRETGETAAVQVKQGSKKLPVELYNDLQVDRFFLFATDGLYGGTPAPNVTCLDPVELRAYLLDRAVHLAPRLQMWVEVAARLADEAR